MLNRRSTAVEVTEVRIKLMNDPHERLLAFCSVTFDGSFVVRDLKIIQGTKGAFVAMPSRKLTDHCPKCHGKNHLRARFCNECGAHMDEDRACGTTDAGRAKLYADIAHPIHSECRESIQSAILAGYETELVRSRDANYVCSYDDYGEDRVAALFVEEEVPAPRIFQTPDERTHRIDPPETLNPNPTRESEPRRIAGRTEDGFAEGIV